MPPIASTAARNIGANAVPCATPTCAADTRAGTANPFSGRRRAGLFGLPRSPSASFSDRGQVGGAKLAHAAAAEAPPTRAAPFKNARRSSRVWASLSAAALASVPASGWALAASGALLSSVLIAALLRRIAGARRRRLLLFFRRRHRPLAHRRRQVSK